MLKLDQQTPLNILILLERRDFDSDFDHGLLLSPDFVPHFLIVLEFFIAPDRKNVLIQILKLLVLALGQDSQHEGFFVLNELEDLVVQIDIEVYFLDAARVEVEFTEFDGVAAQTNEILSQVLSFLFLGRFFSAAHVVAGFWQTVIGVFVAFGFLLVEHVQIVLLIGLA